ncbi:MAG: DUF885 domain-containing protein [Firmicutes bacterium]|nr:DUF885 domain-containing protein [Bacillota bacterium]
MKKHLRILGITMLTLLITVFGEFPALADTQADFDKFLQEDWEETVESDYLTMHSSVFDYRSLGLEKPEVTLGDIDYDEFKESVDAADESLEKLHAFDPAELSDSQKYDYKIYEFYLETLRDLYKYPNLNSMFQPYMGYLTNVTDYFADFPFYEKQDVEDYLTLVAEIPDYIDQMKTFTEQQAEQGYFLDDYSLNDEMVELNDFIEKGEDNNMIVNFEDNLDKFDGITEKEKEAYKARNREIVLDGIIPAYQDVRSFLVTLKGSRAAVGGLCDYPDGADYYDALVRYNCSTDMSVEEMFEFLTKAGVEGDAYRTALLDANPDFKTTEKLEDLTDLDDILAYLQQHMEGFPEGPEYAYSPSYLPPGSNDFAMAYYIPAPVDNIKQNIIRVNKEQMSDINTMYYTLAHEGFPGHLYQFVWHQSQEDYKPFRHELTFMGYEEGWACYVERIMLERSSLDSVTAEYLAIEEFLSYVMYGGCDLAVNGLGYSPEELGDWLEKIGYDRNIAEEMYNISIEMPGAYLPYGFGMAKMWSLRQRVEDALGDDFNEEEFHYQILNHGPRQFELVEEDLNEYVASCGKKMPEEFTFFASGSAKSGGLSKPMIAAVVIGVIILAVFLVMLKKRKKKGELPPLAEEEPAEVEREPVQIEAEEEQNQE